MELYHSPAAEAPTIVNQEDGCVLKRAPIFVMEFADICLQVVKQEDQRIESAMLDF